MQARRRIYTKCKVCLERMDGHETLRAKRDPYACYSCGGEGQIHRYWSVRIIVQNQTTMTSIHYILACLVTTEKFQPNLRKVDSKERLDVCANAVNLAPLQ